jgi:Phosphotransferase enzyme family
MRTESNHDGIEHRVVVIEPSSRKVLMYEANGTLRLPRVVISPQTRPARQLCIELKSLWGIAVLILDYLGTSTPTCVAAELLSSQGASAFLRMNAREIPNNELSDEEQIYLLQVLADEGIGPFSRIGWIDEAIAWMDETTGLSPCAKEDIEQYNAGATSALVRLPVNSGSSHWLKATGVRHGHELRLTHLLSDIAPECLPRFVNAKPEWNAWLAMSAGHALAAMPTEPNVLVRLLGAAVETLAKLQAKTVGKEAELLQAGAFDQRLSIMCNQAHLLFDHVTEAMALQVSTKVPKLEPKRLGEIRRIFEDTCMWIDSQAMPATIIHNDMNLGNLAFTENGCHLLDWAEGYVGHPLVTLQHLLLLNPIVDTSTKASVNRVLKLRYSLVMREVCDPSLLDSAFRLMPLLAAVSALFGRGDWLQSDAPHSTARHAYSRMLARYMDRAVTELSLQEAPCH